MSTITISPCAVVAARWPSTTPNSEDTWDMTI